MASTTRKKPSTETNHRANVAEAANVLLNESKKYAHELYEDSVHKVNGAQQHVKEYGEGLAKKVKKNPIASVLVAAGVGFILSSLLRK